MRVLIITGGHNFDRAAFFDMFNSFPHIDYQEVTHPEANQQLTSSLFDAFDVLVFYDMVQEITAQQREAFINLLQRGQEAVFLHHALASYRNWAEYENITGGRFYLDLKPDTNDKSGYPISTFKHNVDIPVTIADKHHPITLGLDHFVIHDEIYGAFKVLPAVHPLLTTSHPESGRIIGWTHFYGNSPIVYIQPGHGAPAYKNPHYRRLLGQAIKWVHN